MENKGATRAAIALAAAALFSVMIIILYAGFSEGGDGAERPYYGLSPEVFAGLPEFPADFYEVDSRAGRPESAAELPGLPEEYYKQPEFLPTWESIGAERMRNPPEDRIAIWGLGAYPSEQFFSSKAGGEFAAAVFFHSSWMVQTVQGIELVPEYDDALEVRVEPNVFLLGRAYPVFDESWMQKILLKVKVRENAAPGSYEIRLTAKAPPEEYEQEWRSVHKGLYVNAPSASPDRPFLLFRVQVLG